MFHYVIVTSHRTLTDFHDFSINGKKRPYPILVYQTIILWGVNSKFTGGGNHPPPRVTKKAQEDEGNHLL